MKKSIKIVLILTLSLFLVTGCGKEEKKENKPENGIIVNTNENVIKEQEIEGLKITNTSLVIENEKSIFKTEVTNNTETDYNIKGLNIALKDKDGKLITNLRATVETQLKVNESININASSDIDLSNATSVEYSVSK